MSACFSFAPPGKARLVYQSYIPVTGISLSWELGKKQSYEKYPYYATFTATFSPSNATNPKINWSMEDGLSIAKFVDLPDLPDNQKYVSVNTVRNGYDLPGKPLILTVSADNVRASVKIYSYYYTDRDGDKTNGIVQIERV